LKRLYERGDRSGVRPDMVAKVERILQRLDEASDPEQMNLPGYRLHLLGGDRKGFWSVTVNGNWRIVFRFAAGQPHDVELVDYH
ncbi:MAG TPA: type II toxin-antitoxin system RelE/ParE family toxin, partial [Polyangiaceae bacterium]|nr:type II toxin-antitoxin system RelE/ParE family toxin [Polyangiaceae bacterium]